MLRHLRIEAIGRSPDEVVATLDQITKLVTSSHLQSPRLWTLTQTVSSSDDGWTWGEGDVAAAPPVIPEKWRIQEDGGEVIERVVEKWDESVFWRGRRNLVFDAELPTLAAPEGPPRPKLDEKTVSLLERALGKLREHTHEEDAVRVQLEEDIKDALFGKRIVSAPKPIAGELVAFTELAVEEHVTSIGYKPVWEPDIGYEITATLEYQDGPNAAAMPAVVWGPTLGEAVTAMSSTLAGFLNAVEVRGLVDAPQPGGDLFP